MTHLVIHVQINTFLGLILGCGACSMLSQAEKSGKLRKIHKNQTANQLDIK